MDVDECAGDDGAAGIVLGWEPLVHEILTQIKVQL